MTTDLSCYNNNWFQPGSFIKRITWHYFICIFFRPGYFWLSLKDFFTKIIWPNIGKMVLIKPFVHIKYPWLFTIGDDVWNGENVWIDNTVNIHTGDNSCISQGACLLAGNGNYNKKSFDLIPGKIVPEEGVWIGAGQ